MIYKNLDYEYDKEKVIQEIMSCSDLFYSIAPLASWINLAKQKRIFMVESEQLYENITYQDANGIVEKSLKPPMSFYIKKDSNFHNAAYSKAKNFSLENSLYNPSINGRLEYCIKVIEELPFSHIGLIRVFIVENTFLPTHHDGLYNEKFRNLGISLVTIHSGSPLNYFNRKNNKVESTYSSCFLFDDSCLHGIPMVYGLRIDIRIFGILKGDF